jgi:hypothetical protein
VSARWAASPGGVDELVGPVGAELAGDGVERLAGAVGDLDGDCPDPP